MSAKASSDPFGTPEQVGVERGLSELRSGRPVVLTSPSETTVILPVDGMTDGGLAAFRKLCAPVRPHLLVTARRARALGLAGERPTGLAIGDLPDAAAILSLAADPQVSRRLECVPVGANSQAGI